MKEHENGAGAEHELRSSALVAGNGGNGGGGGCGIFVQIGPVEHSHTLHSVGGQLPLPICFEFTLEQPEYGAQCDGGTITVKIGNVAHSHRFKLSDDVNFEFSFKRGHTHKRE
jgi:hypothetical protein